MNPVWKLFLGELFLIENNRGTIAIHAIQFMSDLGNDRVSKTPLAIAKNNLLMVSECFNVFEYIIYYF